MSAANEPDPRPLGHRPNGVPFTVVVADDEFSHRRIMVQILKSAGFQVVAEASNGEEAIYDADFYKPDLMFLDYHMPRLDGLQALRKLHASHPALRVVMFTTETAKERVAEILQAGAADYIVKPLDRAKVLDKLERLVR